LQPAPPPASSAAFSENDQPLMLERWMMETAKESPTGRVAESIASLKSFASFKSF
jgi:hypothetical protein